MTHELAGQRAVVMGLGRFGGGVGVARYLARCGAKVTVTDRLDEAALRDSIEKLADLPIDLHLGGHVEKHFTDADLIVVNPAVDPRDNPYLAAARQAGARLSSEIGLFIDAACAGPGRLRTIGVTGTAGKSTTAAMIGHILHSSRRHHRTNAPRVWVGGNIGRSLLNELDAIGHDDWIVLELSSFMLESIDDWSPHLAVVTNIAPNHLDRHGHMAAYVRAKQTILRHQRHDDRTVLGAGVHDWRFVTPAVCVCEDEPLDTPLAVPGEHNRLNARLAVAACDALGVPRPVAAEALRDFAGLPHRLQLVAARDGVGFCNDSKATTPAAAMLAIDSFPAGCVHAILGGADKRVDLAALAEHAARRCAGIYTLGQTGDAIADAAGHGAKVHRCGTLECAVNTAAARARRGEVVLLSPGCASWDQFDHYEQRGERFVELVAAAASR